MDKEILVQYAEMTEEIKDIRRRIAKLEQQIHKLEKMQVADIVKGSRGEWDVYGPIKITGVPLPGYEQKKAALTRLINLLNEKETELLELMAQAEEYIDSIEKSELRIMFRLYYIDGLPWWKVAQQMNKIFPNRRIGFTEDSCRMRNNRFFEKI